MCGTPQEDLGVGIDHTPEDMLVVTKIRFQLDTGSQITLKVWKELATPLLSEVPHEIECVNRVELIVKRRVRVKIELKRIAYSYYVYVTNRDVNTIGISLLSRLPEIEAMIEDVVANSKVEEAEEEEQLSWTTQPGERVDQVRAVSERKKNPQVAGRKRCYRCGGGHVPEGCWAVKKGCYKAERKELLQKDVNPKVKTGI